MRPTTLEIGQPVPVFHAHDSKGKLISSDLLLGRPYVLYFYPKDDTPGCTTQACGFRDAKIDFDQLKALVIGVSPDTASSHVKFMIKHGLNFILIPDLNHELCTLFHTWEEKKKGDQTKEGVTRTTFVIDAEGIIRWLEKPVQVEGHTQRVLQALKNISTAFDSSL